MKICPNLGPFQKRIQLQCLVSGINFFIQTAVVLFLIASDFLTFSNAPDEFVSKGDERYDFHLHYNQKAFYHHVGYRTPVVRQQNK